MLKGMMRAVGWHGMDGQVFNLKDLYEQPKAALSQIKLGC